MKPLLHPEDMSLTGRLVHRKVSVDSEIDQKVKQETECRKSGESSSECKHLNVICWSMAISRSENGSLKVLCNPQVRLFE